MLRDRGYNIPTSEIDLSLQKFRSIYTQKPDLERLRISAPLISSPSKKITHLLVNIMKHILMPKHEILTPEEKWKLLKKYSLEDKQEILSHYCPLENIIRFIAFHIICCPTEEDEASITRKIPVYVESDACNMGKNWMLNVDSFLKCTSCN